MKTIIQTAFLTSIIATQPIYADQNYLTKDEKFFVNPGLMGAYAGLITECLEAKAFPDHIPYKDISDELIDEMDGYYNTSFFSSSYEEDIYEEMKESAIKQAKNMDAETFAKNCDKVSDLYVGLNTMRLMYRVKSKDS